MDNEQKEVSQAKGGIERNTEKWIAIDWNCIARESLVEIKEVKKKPEVNKE